LLQEIIRQVLIEDFKTLVTLLGSFILGDVLKQRADVFLSDLLLLFLLFLFDFDFSVHYLFLLLVLDLGQTAGFQLSSSCLKLGSLLLILLFQHQSK